MPCTISFIDFNLHPLSGSGFGELNIPSILASILRQAQGWPYKIQLTYYVYTAHLSRQWADLLTIDYIFLRYCPPTSKSESVI